MAQQAAKATALAQEGLVLRQERDYRRKQRVDMEVDRCQHWHQLASLDTRHQHERASWS